jgi:hypothetical protein
MAAAKVDLKVSSWVARTVASLAAMWTFYLDDWMAVMWAKLKAVESADRKALMSAVSKAD